MIVRRFIKNGFKALTINTSELLKAIQKIIEIKRIT